MRLPKSVSVAECTPQDTAAETTAVNKERKTAAEMLRFPPLPFPPLNPRISIVRLALDSSAIAFAISSERSSCAMARFSRYSFGELFRRAGIASW